MVMAAAETRHVQEALDALEREGSVSSIHRGILEAAGYDVDALIEMHIPYDPEVDEGDFDHEEDGLLML